jgi:Protein of unknown function (DUF732)
LLSTVSPVIFRFLALAAGIATAGAALAAPIRADMIGNAFLSALTNAGVSYSQPASTTALGQSVCPMLVSPGASFDSVTSWVTANNGLPYEKAGSFTIVAIATFCPAVIAPLFTRRLA